MSKSQHEWFYFLSVQNPPKPYQVHTTFESPAHEGLSIADPSSPSLVGPGSEKSAGPLTFSSVAILFFYVYLQRRIKNEQQRDSYVR